jgi:hypothetical protein
MNPPFPPPALFFFLSSNQVKKKKKKPIPPLEVKKRNGRAKSRKGLGGKEIQKSLK